VMTPPFATAARTADDVQLAAVPVPTTRLGLELSAARPAAGTGAVPFRFPGRGNARPATGVAGVGGAVDGFVAEASRGAAPGEGVPVTSAPRVPDVAAPRGAAASAVAPHPAATTTTATRSAHRRNLTAGE
jgi:hypothetical protein